jgi:hypothetical protein
MSARQYIAHISAHYYFVAVTFRLTETSSCQCFVAEFKICDKHFHAEVSTKMKAKIKRLNI